MDKQFRQRLWIISLLLILGIIFFGGVPHALAQSCPPNTDPDCKPISRGGGGGCPAPGVLLLLALATRLNSGSKVIHKNDKNPTSENRASHPDLHLDRQVHITVPIYPDAKEDDT